jgi:CDGSH-type Zn-finger protein
MQITVKSNGPYVVSGNVPLILGQIAIDENGDSVGYREVRTIDTPAEYTLCRCGLSKNKPFCDGSHVSSGFDGLLTAVRASHDSQSKRYKGDDIVLLDDKTLCIGARFCDRGLGVWQYTEESGNPEYKDAAIDEACLCTSGRLVMYDKDGKPIETEYEPSIVVLEDPARESSSALWVRGGIPIVDEMGRRFEVRNRQTICRCGNSRNKPYCDGFHYAVQFDDGFINA